MASDRWALKLFKGSSDVGQYQALFQLGYYPIALASQALDQLTQPLLFQRAGNGTDPMRIRTARKLTDVVVAGCLALTVIATGLAAVGHTVIVGTLADRAYGDGSYLLPVLVFGGGLFASGQAAAGRHLAAGSPRSLLRPKILSAVVAIPVNIIAARFWGVAGVAYSVALFGLSYFLMMLCASRQKGGRALEPQ
jgi:O-antigen/teichoic acid export membrane protein